MADGIGVKRVDFVAVPSTDWKRSRAFYVETLGFERGLTVPEESPFAFASVTGGPEAPARVGISCVDICTGMNAYEAILEALIARGRSGLSMSQWRSFIQFVSWRRVP